MIEIMKTQPNLTYIFLKKQEGAEIKRLIENGEKVTYSKTDCWITIKGKCYNGWSRRCVERLFIEQREKIKKSVLVEYIVKKTAQTYDKLKNRSREYLENIYNEITKEKQL